MLGVPLGATHPAFARRGEELSEAPYTHHHGVMARERFWIRLTASYSPAFSRPNSGWRVLLGGSAHGCTSSPIALGGFEMLPSLGSVMQRLLSGKLAFPERSGVAQPDPHNLHTMSVQTGV